MIPASFFPTDPVPEISVSEVPDYPITQVMESKYVDILQSSTVPGNTVFLHAHSFYEVLFCRHVSDVEYLVGTERYRLQKGDLIFIPPGVAHCPLLLNRGQEPYRRDGLRMSPEFLSLATVYSGGIPVSEITATPFLLRTNGTRWAFLGDLFRQCVTESREKKPGWELVVIAKAAEMLVHLHRALNEPSAGPLPAEKPELLDQVLEYITEHLREKISLADVSRVFFVSQSTITQTFRNRLGISFYRCVTQRRLIVAKRMMEAGIPLEQISEQIGFKDYSSFYRAFKQEYGISPRQYRTLRSTHRP